MASLMLLVLENKLLVALLSGLLAFELIRFIEPHLIKFARIKGKVARMSIVVAIGVLISAAIFLLVFWILKYFHSGSDNLATLFNKLAEILDVSRNTLPSWLTSLYSNEIHDLKNSIVEWLKEHADLIQGFGKYTGRSILLIVIGVAIGCLISLDNVETAKQTQYTFELLKRFELFANSFRKVVFAQFWIALANVTLTAIYLLVVLPIFQINLPFMKTILILTFVLGLIPVIGNILSNTIITLVSLSVSLSVAFWSLVFLILVHKFEYFLNAKIVSQKINSKPWELLIAMLLMESIFGIAGVVSAPILYSYIKDELSTERVI